MLVGLVLVCSLNSTPDLAACNSGNAMYVMPLPNTFASPVTCLMHGQAYLAQTAFGRKLASDERAKVICAFKRALGRTVVDASPAR